MVRQRLGQHFLADSSWREKIARAMDLARLSPTSISVASAAKYCWIEIGAGHGEMTEHLAASGVPVYALELDPSLTDRLRRLSTRFSNVTVVTADILQTDLASLAAGRRLRIYGNLPYYITSPILHHVFSFANLVDEMHVVMQMEVALRVTARPNSKLYGFLSVATQFYARPEFILRIPPGAFRPPPEVSSALVTLRFPGERAKISTDDDGQFLEFVKLCFSQKRKTLVNNLRIVASPEETRSALASIHRRPDSRAEQLPVFDFAALAKKLNPAVFLSLSRPARDRDNQ
jgi:16S rRNA (adenine1518-N6/adenine1519-N6)-dimethyltransferase